MECGRVDGGWFSVSLIFTLSLCTYPKMVTPPEHWVFRRFSECAVFIIVCCYTNWTTENKVESLGHVTFPYHHSPPTKTVHSKNKDNENQFVTLGKLFRSIPVYFFLAPVSMLIRNLPVVFKRFADRFLYFGTVSAKALKLFHEFHNGVNFLRCPGLGFLVCNLFGPTWH